MVGFEGYTVKKNEITGPTHFRSLFDPIYLWEVRSRRWMSFPSEVSIFHRIFHIEHTNCIVANFEFPDREGKFLLTLVVLRIYK